MNGHPQFNQRERDIWRDSSILEKDAWYRSYEDALRAVAGPEYKDNTHNGPGDAVRHCVYSCELARRMNKEESKKRTDAHEPEKTDDPQEQQESEMDLHNNKVGCDLSEEGKKEQTYYKELEEIKIITYKDSCKSLCEKALKEKQLRVLPKKHWGP